MKKLPFWTVLLLTVQAFATISQVQSKATWSATGITCAVTFTSSPSNNNLIALWTSWTTTGTNGVAANASDSLGNIFLSAGPTVQSASNTAGQIFYAKKITGGSSDTITVTFTAAPTFSNCVIVEYSGADQNYPLDSTSAGYSYNPGSLLDSGNAAPANANLLVFGGGTSDAGTTSAGSGFTAIQSHMGSITEQNTNLISGNNVLQRATAGSTVSGNWLMQMASFRDASWTVQGGWSPVRLPQVVFADQFPGGDLGAKIQAADAALGGGVGQIWVATSGSITENPLSLSANHDLICVGDQTSITMTSGAYIQQASNTRIRGCTFSSTQTAVPGSFGEIYSSGSMNVEVRDSTFTGGGPHIVYTGVSQFRIVNTRHTSVTAFASLIYLTTVDHGYISGVRVESFNMVEGTGLVAMIGVTGSSFIEVEEPFIQVVDASPVKGGAAGVLFQGVKHSSVIGGIVNGNINMDGILLQSYSNVPSTDIVISGFTATQNGNTAGIGTNMACMNLPCHNLGDGIDVINSARVRVVGCNLRNNGNVSTNRHPAMDVFISSDITVESSELSDAGFQGIDVFGTPHAQLIGNHYNRNFNDGVLGQTQTGTVTVSGGTTVTWNSSPTGAGFGIAWQPGTAITICTSASVCTVSQIATVPSNTSLTLQTAVPNGSGQTYSVDSYDLQVLGGEAMDNGEGGTSTNGIELQGGTAGLISGVVAGDDRPSGLKTQTVGFKTDPATTARARLVGNDFMGGCSGCGNSVAAVQDNVGASPQLFDDGSTKAWDTAGGISIGSGLITTGTATNRNINGKCTMSSGVCPAIVFTTPSYASKPTCTCSWDGSGMSTGIVKCNQTVSQIAPTSTVNTDTGEVSYICVGNPN